MKKGPNTEKVPKNLCHYFIIKVLFVLIVSPIHVWLKTNVFLHLKCTCDPLRTKPTSWSYSPFLYIHYGFHLHYRYLNSQAAQMGGSSENSDINDRCMGWPLPVGPKTMQLCAVRRMDNFAKILPCFFKAKFAHILSVIHTSQVAQATKKQMQDISYGMGYFYPCPHRSFF